MGFDVTALSNWVNLKSKEIATKAVAQATTAKLLIDNNSVQVGVKGSAAILKMDSDVALQSATCSRTATGNIALSDKSITVVKIADYTNLCQAQLDNKYYQVMVSQGASPEQPIMDVFASQIMDLRTSKIALANEQLLWQGDTSLTGNTNLSLFNGIAKQVTGATYIAITSAATGSTIVEKLQAAYLAIPVDIRTQEDFRMFIGQDLYDSYSIALSNKNIYKPTSDTTLFGTTAKLQPTSGLNGTKQLFAARISNLQLGLDGTDDADKAELRYSIETKNWYMDYNYALGVAVIFPEQVGFASGLN